jgi:hypothetical protein
MLKTLYAQDDLKVTSRLTLNLGIRYDLMLPWQEAGLQSSTVTFNTSFQSTRFPTAPPGYGFPGEPGIADGLTFADKTDFAPRLGFAYDVFGDGKSAVRGGYGIFYNAPGAITLANSIEPPPFSAELTFFPNSFSNPYGATYTNPFPFTLNPSKPLWTFPTQAYCRNCQRDSACAAVGVLTRDDLAEGQDGVCVALTIKQRLPGT